MNVNQVYSLLNSVAEQYQGKDFPQVVDASSFISYGNTVISSSTNTDNFLNTLVDRIGRTVIRTLDLDINYPNIMRDSFEFGAILQKITVEPLDAQSVEAWNVGDVSFTPNQFKIDAPKVRQSLFTDINTWEFDLTIPDKLFKTAFTNESMFASFVDALIASMTDSMTLYINYANRLCVNTAIANKIQDDENVVHLITEYADASVTIANCLTNPGFLKFMGKRIGDMIRYMKEPGVAFNHEKVVRATTRDNMHVFLIGEAAAAYSTYLEADTFHNDLVALPLYQEVTAWQGSFASDLDPSDPQPVSMPDFTTSCYIDIKLDANTTVAKGGIVCALFDREALGSTMYDIRTAADRNNRDEYTNYTNKADIGYFYDSSENGVVFVLD